MWSKCMMILILMLLDFIISQDVGEICMATNQGLEGTCIEVSKCELAIRAIRNKQYHQFHRCGFSGLEEVVCCPNTTNKFGNTPNGNINNNNGGDQRGGNDQTKAERIVVRECQKIIANSIPPLDLHILGGEAASVGEFPHMVGLGFDTGNGYEFNCGGSVVSKTYVLTAVHCVDNLEGIEPTIVRGGVIDIGGSEFNPTYDVRIAQIIPNPRYTRRKKYHDLALLRLEKPLQFSSNLNAICIETSNADPTAPLTITGWGKISNSRETRSNILLKANVTAVPRSKCNESYTNWRKLPYGISDDQICAGDPEGIRDTCQGDSGGPLVTTSDGAGQNRLIGVTSFGRGCGSPIPGVYTRVSRYLDWIQSVVWPN